jgi:hypothetical protein
LPWGEFSWDELSWGELSWGEWSGNQMFTYPVSLWRMESVETSRLLISTCHFSKAL